MRAFTLPCYLSYGPSKYGDVLRALVFRVVAKFRQQNGEDVGLPAQSQRQDNEYCHLESIKSILNFSRTIFLCFLIKKI